MIWRFLIFLTVFLSVYGGVHTYIFFRLKSAFVFPHHRTAVIVTMVLLGLTPVMVRILERTVLAPLIRCIGFVGYTWMGAVLLLFFMFLGWDLYRLIMHTIGFAAQFNIQPLVPPATPVVTVMLVICGTILGYGLWEAQAVTVERVTVRTSKLPAGVDGFKIAQISDVHLGQLIGERRLRKITGLVNREQPDLFVCTGDLVDEDMRCHQQLADILRQVEAPAGRYAVTGNHEMFSNLKEALRFMESSGFTVLRNRAEAVGEHLVIAGVDDRAAQQMGLFKTVPDSEVLTGLPADKFVLFLKHTPQIKESLKNTFDLMLSGHTHSGQIFPFHIFTRLAFKYHRGKYTRSDGSTVYVSRGTGTWGPPVRFLARPEVTIIELVPEH